MSGSSQRFEADKACRITFLAANVSKVTEVSNCTSH